MSAHSVEPQTSSPRLGAEQSLLRLLELIRGSRRIGDITPSRLQSVFGVDLQEQDGRHAYSEQLSPEWWVAFELNPLRALGAQFELAFRPSRPKTYPSAESVCAVDFERFAGELERQGFARTTYRAEHGRVIHHRFERPDIAVTVYTRGESDASPEKIAHTCVQMVHIH